MARGTLAVQPIVNTGLEPTYTAADAVDGHEFENDGKTFLHVANGATAVEVTVSANYSREGLTLPDLSVTVSASESRMIGPFDKIVFNQDGADKGKVFVDVDDASNVTLAAIRLP